MYRHYSIKCGYQPCKPMKKTLVLEKMWEWLNNNVFKQKLHKRRLRECLSTEFTFPQNTFTLQVWTSLPKSRISALLHHNLSQVKRLIATTGLTYYFSMLFHVLYIFLTLFEPIRLTWEYYALYHWTAPQSAETWSLMKRHCCVWDIWSFESCEHINNNILWHIFLFKRILIQTFVHWSRLNKTYAQADLWFLTNKLSQVEW